MYNTFFGFKEKPFTLNPDPEYIFLSKSHDEVLSHLTYAIYEGNGFAKITGKVGSGKTLLCRTFLEGLDESVNSAYIFNPKLDSIQLLKTINDEFGIESHEPFDEKSLVDSLNNFLIRQKTEGKKSVLIIDEAQELSIDALEQIRLLSNLETIKNKLIQIIIVGQSELNLLLEKHELRQLAQRISLSCELSSLTFAETKDYISHRLHIASRRRGDIFSKDAVKEIYEYSKGIPRLINIVCDRMLLTAFSNNSKYVTKKIAEITLDEIHQVRKQRVSFNYRIVIAGIIGIIFLAISLFFIVKYDKTPIAFNEKISSEKTPVPRIEEPAPVTKKTVPSVEARLPVKKAGIESILVDSSEMRAVKDIIKLWNVEFNDPVVPLLDNSGMNMFFDSIGQYNNFMVKKLGADIMLLKKLNIPAILELNPIEAGGPKFVVLTGIAEDKDEVVLTSGEDSVIVSVRELYTNRFSNAYIFWKNFFNIVGTPPFDTSPSSISSLKILLRNIGFTDIIPNYEFDMDTDTAIRATQKKHGVLQDGIVGSLTKIILYNELGTLDIPHIRFGAERSEQQLSSVLKALKKAEKEKSDASSPFIYSFLKGSEKKISYKGIKNVLFVVLLLSFVSSLLYLYDFNKRDNNIIEREPEIEKKVGQKNTEVSDISDIKEKPELQSRVIEYREPSSIFPVNRIEEPAQEEEIEIVAENQPRSEQEIFQETTPLPEKSMQDIQLNMISWTYDPNSRIAIINNIAMKEGEIKNGIKILKINIKDVVITHNNVKQVITFRSKKGLY